LLFQGDHFSSARQGRKNCAPNNIRERLGGKTQTEGRRRRRKKVFKE
jgi:hypothetical protein